MTTATMTVGFPSMFPAAGRGLPFQVLLGEQPEDAGSGRTRQLQSGNRKGTAPGPAGWRHRVQPKAQPGTISAAALDDPGPIVSASQFTRADLPVFLLKKIDGADETLP